MSLFAARTSLLRVREGHVHHRVTFVELFYDLVFVFAITQLSHGLLGHLTPLGVLQTAILMIAVWWAWIDAAWITNWLDPDKPAVRLYLFALMLGGLVLSVSIPKAFEERAVVFAVTYVAMQAGRNLFMLWALKRQDHGNFVNFLRIGLWHLLDAVFWIAGCFVDGAERIALWSVAAGIETLGPMCGFFVPGFGRSTTADWTVEGGHMAERCGLFIIIALGESVLITGATFADLAWTPDVVAAFVVSFAGSVALWTVYFNIGAERASKQIASSADPGRLARSGYTYIHIIIVAGIIVTAVGDELVLHHPLGYTDIKTASVVLGGPALYLAGNSLFKHLSAPYFPLSHSVGLGLLALLIAAVPFVSPLVLSAGSTFVLIVVAVWEWLSLRRRGGIVP
jgi:low temperature requirement protein LtrA